MKRALGLIVLAACGSSARPPLSNQSNDGDRWTIVPGRSIGAARLGMSRDEIERALGKPSGEVSSRGITALVWLGDELPAGEAPESQRDFMPFHHRLVALIDGDQVVQIEASSPRYHDPKRGFSTAQTVVELERSLPGFTTRHWQIGNVDDSASTPASKHFVDQDDDVARGLALAYDAWGNLAPDPSVDGPPAVIIVHRPGHGVIVDPVDALPFAGASARSFEFPAPTKDAFYDLDFDVE